jgi:hypothetical protein
MSSVSLTPSLLAATLLAREVLRLEGVEDENAVLGGQIKVQVEI